MDSSVSDVLSNAERLIDALDNPEISRRFREHSRQREAAGKQRLPSCSPVPCLDMSKTSALGGDASVCRDISIFGGEFLTANEQRALREMTNAPELRSLRSGRPAQEIEPKTPLGSSLARPNGKEIPQGGISAAEVQEICQKIGRMCQEMVPGFDFSKSQSEHGVHAHEGLEAIAQRLNVLGMTVSARLETTGLIRARLKEELEEVTRRADEAEQQTRRLAQQGEHVQGQLRANAAATAEEVRRQTEALAAELARREAAETRAAACQEQLAATEAAARAAREEAVAVQGTLEREREMRATVAADLLAMREQVASLEAQLRETRLLQKFLPGAAARAQAQDGPAAREGGGARGREVAELRAERQALLERCPPLPEGVYSRDTGRGNSREGGGCPPSLCLPLPLPRPLFQPRVLIAGSASGARCCWGRTGSWHATRWRWKVRRRRRSAA